MGAEVRCVARFGKNESDGKALLETEQIIFRGEFKLTIPFRRMKSVTARDGRLEIVFPDGKAVFELGALAAKWEAKIRNPKSILDKLGVKPEHRVAALGVIDAGFMKDLRARVSDLSESEPKRDCDVIFVALNQQSELARLANLRESLKPNGALWVIRPKGVTAITESQVRAGGIAAGLVDVKVARFSETHTAEKFVIPVAQR